MRLFAGLSAAVLGAALLASAASAQEVQERTIRWGHLNNTDHPVSFGVKKFAEILSAKSGGKLNVRELAASQLGNELQQQSALRGGTQEMLSASTTSLATVVPEFGLLDFPFIVSTTDQADALVQGAFGKAMMDVLPQRGLIALGYWGLGFRNVTNSKHPIAKLEDFAGLKLRVIPNPVYLDSFSAFKANPIPMAFGELYTAWKPAPSTARKIPTPSSSPTNSMKFRSTFPPPAIPSRKTSSSSARSSGTSSLPPSRR